MKEHLKIINFYRRKIKPKFEKRLHFYAHNFFDTKKHTPMLS